MSSALHGVDHVRFVTERQDEFDAPHLLPKNPTQSKVGPWVSGCWFRLFSFVPSIATPRDPSLGRFAR